MSDAILVINSGSSSVKYALYDPDRLVCIRNGEKEFKNTPSTIAYKQALENIINEADETIIAAGHRIVHGGQDFDLPMLVDEDILEKLRALIPLAPLHQPFNLMAVEMLRKINPALPQVVCFDTAFHRIQDPLSQLYALPKALSDEGILRYGFHGLSYEYIALKLAQYTNKVEGRVIAAHLGNGASLCAMKSLKSVSSTMGFTALEGLMMGTRCGQLDPGIILYLLEQKNMSVEETTDMLYKKSGIWGVSGISADIRDVLKSDSREAKTAIDLFCRYAVRAIGRLTAELEGLDVLVFTAGIGEHQPFIREKICEKLGWLGLKLDEAANANNELEISAKDSAIDVLVIPTNEECIIARHTKTLLTL